MSIIVSLSTVNVPLYVLSNSFSMGLHRVIYMTASVSLTVSFTFLRNFLVSFLRSIVFYLATYRVSSGDSIFSSGEITTLSFP